MGGEERLCKHRDAGKLEATVKHIEAQTGHPVGAVSVDLSKPGERARLL